MVVERGVVTFLSVVTTGKWSLLKLVISPAVLMQATVIKCQAQINDTNQLYPVGEGLDGKQKGIHQRGRGV